MNCLKLKASNGCLIEFEGQTVGVCKVVRIKGEEVELAFQVDPNLTSITPLDEYWNKKMHLLSTDETAMAAQKKSSVLSRQHKHRFQASKLDTKEGNI